MWGRLGHGMRVFATVDAQAEGSVWLALSHQVCVGILINSSTKGVDLSHCAVLLSVVVGLNMLLLLLMLLSVEQCC